MKKKRKLFFIIGVLLCFILVVVSFQAKNKRIEIELRPLLSPNEVSVLVNGKNLLLVRSDEFSSVYLYEGKSKDKIEIEVSHPQYQTVKKDFVVSVDHTIVIDLVKITASEDSLFSVAGVDREKLEEVVFFANNSWAVLLAPQEKTQDKVYVLRYNTKDGLWENIVNGVGITPDNKKLLLAPKELLIYLGDLYAYHYHE